MKDSAFKYFGSNKLWTFQQNGEPAHTANITQTWCRDRLPRFWPKEKWPPCSPDLNPVDFSIWSILETKAFLKFLHSVRDLRISLTRSWDQISQEMLRAAAIAANTRFEAVVAQKGDYIE